MDIAQPSMTKVGGLSEMRKVARAGRARERHAGAALVLLRPRTGGDAPLRVATPGVPYVEFPPAELEAPLLAEPIRCVDGHVDAGDRPGLGADPDPDVLARYPYRRDGARPFDLT